MKVHVVREAFSVDGVDYARGAEIRDVGLILKLQGSHPTHIQAQGEDLPAATASQPAQQPDRVQLRDQGAAKPKDA